MRADALDVTGAGSGLSVAITLYRGTATLAAQYVRLYGSGGAAVQGAGGVGTEASQTTVRIVGAPTLDIRARDRFNHNGQSYEVTAVMPQRQVATEAIARLLQ